MSSFHELPVVTPLPPMDPIVPHSQEALVDQELEYFKSPVPSFADSFSTAFTSPTRDQGHSSPRLLSPPTNLLRKSVSVDSFVNTTSVRSTRPQPEPEPSRTRGYSAAIPPRTDKAYPWTSRSRGASVSSGHDDYDSPTYADSDVERFDPQVPTDRYRHASIKTQDSHRPVIRGGELPLPSRSQGLSATSSMNSVLTASTSSSQREAHPALRSVSSLQASTRAQQASKLETGRTRSGSLGVYTSSHPKRMTINTHIETPKSGHSMTLAVIGTATCGKSYVISKGLINYSLSEAVTSYVPNNIRYTRRNGRIPSESANDAILHVVEVDIPSSITASPPLPSDIPALDGVIICYDASNTSSFQPVEVLLKEYRAKKLPIIVLACKTDLERAIEPDRALELLQEYDVGLVEVTSALDGGKGKMRQSFDWLVKAVFRSRQSQKGDDRNPASPEYLRNPSQPWELSRNSTPTAASGLNDVSTVPFGPSSPSAQVSSPSTSVSPTSPIRARSTGDLLYENERSRIRSAPQEPRHIPSDVPTRPRHSSETREERIPDSAATSSQNVVPEARPEKMKKDPPQAQWAALEELLDKLLFLAVSGDDPAFISHFLLTYRRFATPRSVLLAMQKRMRLLDNPSGDPMFACFAQMRICHLLETWIRDYPDDFAVKGTAGALTALIKSIISKTHLLHYGSEFLPFLEMLPSRQDQDSAWALRVEVMTDESDDSYSLLEDEEDDAESGPREPVDSPPSRKPNHHQQLPPNLRERKSSLPLTKLGSLNSSHGHSSEPSPKQQLKDLVKLAQDVLNVDSEDIAQEITRQWVKRFLDIKPRDWLHYAFISSKRPDSDPITCFNKVSNHLADWVISLILCHDRPRHRARQIEKFVDVAHRLRMLNNYSALRAVVAGINSSTFPGDETMETFKSRFPENAKNLQSFDLLLQQIRAHRAYRLALRNSKGACIPAMEVHMSDLIRANEGNGDFNEADPTKIHWGKFNMMGRFVDTTTQCQVQCNNSNDYAFIERPGIADLLVKRPVMTTEMQKSRLAALDSDLDDPRPHNSSQPKDIVGLRKMFFW
ncbi:ras GEF [Coprinopsis marcescibilis]|uniref:Ras GEF n=1 Tax=Coprinopsis marcescibilis TaxID=230819 RepID=A0A5C3LDC5_COPMA|nr:ras GEF [Coprinopsis marcescibilis]